VSRLAKFVAIVAALGLLWVLITPALDELPSTTGHRTFSVLALTASAQPVTVQPALSSFGLLSAVNPSFAVVDMLSLTCAFIC
jgi:hypothetical protein